MQNTQYTLGKVIGAGRNSAVTHISQCKKYAIKVVPKIPIQSAKANHEGLIWKYASLSSHNVPFLYEVNELNNCYHFVSEPFNNCLAHTKTNVEDAAAIIKQVAEATQKLHDVGVAHGDMRPEKILFNDANFSRVVLSDFGSTILSLTETSGGYTHDHCNMLYQPPELLRKADFGYKIDTWALGVILFQMLNQGYMPFYNRFYPVQITPSREEMLHVLQCKPIQWRKDLFPAIPDAAIDLVTRMLKRQAKERMTMTEVINHEFFKQ